MEGLHNQLIYLYLPSNKAMSIDYNSHFDSSLRVFIKKKYNTTVESFEFQVTRKEFDGDTTLVVFSLLRYIKSRPEELAQAIGDFLVQNHETVLGFNVVKGFLNLTLSDSFYLNQFHSLLETPKYGILPLTEESPTVMVEFSSPNTNKPLHLGHIRNNLLGYSVARILEANGKRVVKTQIINDRGIHICKSMVAWQKFGNGETPESTGLKGDQLVGKYYVKFDQEYKKQIQQLTEEGQADEAAQKNAPLLLEAQSMLRLWEANDPEIRPSTSLVKLGYTTMTTGSKWKSLKYKQRK